MSDFSRLMELALAADQAKTQEALGGGSELAPTAEARREAAESRTTHPPEARREAAESRTTQGRK